LRNRILIIALPLLIVSCQQNNIAKCLDNGGRWNYEQSKCVYVSDSVSVEDKEQPVSSTIANHAMSIDSIEEEQKEKPTADTDTILLRYKEILAINNQETQQNFIDAYPNSFKKMQETFGYDDEKGPAPYYDHIIGGGMIKLFSELDPIDKGQYYNKLINICINGKWEADNIRGGFGIYKKMIKNPNDIYQSISTRTDAEIESVFKFIFDGPHPNNEENNKIYNQIIEVMPLEFKRERQLLELAYNELIEEDHNH